MNATQPTDKQMRKGPVVTMVGTHFAGGDVSFHGLAYPIRFDHTGKAKVYGPHFDEWIGDDRAAKMGFVVSKGK